MTDPDNFTPEQLVRVLMGDSEPRTAEDEAYLAEVTAIVEQEVLEIYERVKREVEAAREE